MKIMKLSVLKWFILGSLLLSACAAGAQVGEPEGVQPSPTGASATEPAPTSGEEPTQEPTERPVATLDPDIQPPRGAAREFNTDFNKHSVPYDEILSGGPPKDGIPAIDDPKFNSIGEADEWLNEQEPVILVQVEDEARAYPIQILMWHEIVNDTVGDKPLVITFCPLCNTAIAFERSLDGQVFDFGTTGRLRFSNLIMYDRQTETWWQQATGDAIAGELTGEKLQFYPATIISWEQFKNTYPDGEVLSRNTGFARDYGRNPYSGYDNINQSPFLFRGPDTPGRLPAMARVLTVEIGDEAVAYPYEILEEIQVIHDTVGDQELVIFWQPGVASPLDSVTVSGGRDVGAAEAYSRSLDDLTLSFVIENGRIFDEQTGSEWNVLGQAVDGELAGRELDRMVTINHFWFSWAAFRPETRVYQP